MTLEIVFSSHFKKDFKRIKKRNKDPAKLIHVIELLANEINLPEKYRNHKLIGNFKEQFECHIEPDWLLIYVLIDNKLYLARTGSHSDLF